MTDAQLIALILSAYTLSQEDIEALAEGIALARLTVMQASYRRAQHTVGLVQNWTPSRVLTKRIEQKSRKDAEGIADTYKGYLTSFVEKALQQVKKSLKGWHDLFGSVVEAIASMMSTIGEWLKDFLGWKPDQIASATAGAGLHDGTMQFVEDVLAAAESDDGTIEGDDGMAVIDLSLMDMTIAELGVKVVPSQSSSDLCALYSGNVYPFPDALELPPFPLHSNCIHSTVVVVMI